MRSSRRHAFLLSLLVLVAPLAARAASLDPLGLGALPVTSAASADAWLDREEALLSEGPSPDPDEVSGKAKRRIDRLVRVMDKRWRKLDAACDPAAVFALTYLLTTIRIGEFVEARYFDDGDTMSIIMVAFAALYFDAYDTFVAGRPQDVSKPWREALEGGASGTTTVTEDVFLGMNAHINYNLAIVMAAIGIVDANGRSRKPDHDRINDALASVIEEISTELARRYDPSLAPGGANALAEPAVLQLVYGWREHAWQQAVLITALPDAESRARHDAALQEGAAANAKFFRTPKMEPTAPARIAYCSANP